MTTIAVQLKTACPRCAENIPLNRITPRVECPRCQAPIDLDTATWKKLLEAPALDGPRAEPEKPHVATVEATAPSRGRSHAKMRGARGAAQRSTWRRRSRRPSAAGSSVAAVTT